MSDVTLKVNGEEHTIGAFRQFVEEAQDQLRSATRTR